MNVVTKDDFLSQTWKQLITLTLVKESSFGYPVRDDSLDNCVARNFAVLRNTHDCSGDETMNNEHVDE